AGSLAQVGQPGLEGPLQRLGGLDVPVEVVRADLGQVTQRRVDDEVPGPEDLVARRGSRGSARVRLRHEVEASVAWGVAAVSAAAAATPELSGDGFVAAVLGRAAL